jgi:hypothetical protein
VSSRRFECLCMDHLMKLLELKIDKIRIESCCIFKFLPPVAMAVQNRVIKHVACSISLLKPECCASKLQEFLVSSEYPRQIPVPVPLHLFVLQTSCAPPPCWRLGPREIQSQAAVCHSRPNFVVITCWRRSHYIRLANYRIHSL